MQGMLRRAARSARLDKQVFREVVEDEGTVLNALGLVVLSGIAIAVGMSGGFGEGVELIQQTETLTDRLLCIWFAIVSLMVGWVLWASVVLGMGKLFMHGGATYRQIVRAVGFAFAPGILLVLMAIEPISVLIFNLVTVWALVIGVFAIHEAQETDWVGAALSGFVGWLICFRLIPAFVLSPFFSGSV